MKTSNKTLALTISGAFALSIGAASIHATENPFAIKSLSSGYQVADANTTTGTKMKDGKCATGKCGANKKKTMEKEMKEGSCSAEKMKAKEGNCSAEMKAKEGNCSAEMKAKK
jgi:uncharacterized low-complexity protein